MSTKSILDACQKLQDAWPALRQDFATQNEGRYLDLTCVSRPPEEQFADYQKGRVKQADGTWQIVNKNEVITNVDGYKIVGKHNKMPSEAIDVVVMDNRTGQSVWGADAYEPLAALAKQYGLVWGGSWKSIKDYDHLETA